MPPLRPWDHIREEQQMEPCSLAGSPHMSLIPAWGFAPATKSLLADDSQPFSLLPGPGLCTQSSSVQPKQAPISHRREWGLPRILPHLIILRGSKGGLHQMSWLVIFVCVKSLAGNFKGICNKLNFTQSGEIHSLGCHLTLATFLFSKFFCSQKCKLQVCLFPSKIIWECKTTLWISSNSW